MMLNQEFFYFRTRDLFHLQLLTEGKNQMIEKLKISEASQTFLKKDFSSSILLFGPQEELFFKKNLTTQKKRNAWIDKICEKNPFAMIFCHPSFSFINYFKKICQRKPIWSFMTELSYEKFRKNLQSFIPKMLAPYLVVPGTFMEVFHQGILLIGESGRGKSSLALELIHRGHGFIADDVVKFTALYGRLVGSSLVFQNYPIEFKPFGLLDVKESFGPKVMVEEKELDFVVELDKPLKKIFSLLDIEVPSYFIPEASFSKIETLALMHQVKKFTIPKKNGMITLHE